MTAQIIQIGNSKGIRLPKALMAQCGLEDKVFLTVTADGLLITPLKQPREGWSIAAQTLAKEEDELKAVRDMPHSFDYDEKEWTW